MNTSYQRYGPEWEAEMMKWSKPNLIGLLRKELWAQQEPPESIRDRLAMAALTGILSAYGPHAKQDEGGLMLHESIFSTAYKAADAMLEARRVVA